MTVLPPNGPPFSRQENGAQEEVTGTRPPAARWQGCDLSEPGSD